MFLQNWRTTLVPAVAVPVVLLGTFGVLAAFGYSINMLTLFALVLVIGLLVDDAIVVVENVERIMREEGLPPREATLLSMKEITGALIGIGLVLTAVFLPMAFFGGSTGVIYRQFSVTIVSAMLLSIMVALVLTPALCATLLKPIEGGGHAMPAAGWAASLTASTTISSSSAPGIAAALEWVLDRSRTGHDVYGGDRGGAWRFFFTACRPAFCRTRTRASSSTWSPCRRAPPAAHARGGQAGRELLPERREDNADYGLRRRGLQPFAGAGQNAGMAFVKLKDWNERPGRQERRLGDRAARLRRPSPGFPTRRSFPSCRLRCRNWVLPAASIWKWKTAAILAMPR